jgi:hypothetical protein
MAENELIRLYREELRYVIKREIIGHRDSLNDLLYIIGQNIENCVITYTENNLVRVSYWRK